MQVMRRLQMMMNAAVRMVTGCSKYEHIIPVLRDVLHWLSVPQRNIAFLAFSCIRDVVPAYFQHVCIYRRQISLAEPVSVLRNVEIWSCREQQRNSAKRFQRCRSGNSLPKHLRSSSISKRQFWRGL